MLANRIRKLLFAALIVQISVGLRAQAPPFGDQPVSYVSSIKRNTEANPRGGSEYSRASGRFTATAVNIATLLRLAYRIQPYQLAGLPDSISGARYDITAKADDSPAPQQQMLLRALLRDRFKLSVRNETREMPIFALVLARKNAELGPKLIKSSFDCAAWLAGPHPPPEPGRTPTCATRIGPGSLFGNAISIATLATSLAPFVSRFTVDKTGLTGGYNVELTWTPDRGLRNPPDNQSFDPRSDSSAPTIFTALQEQLGLKLNSEKGPVPVLVVDHVAEPSAN
jgi:uncharacterized protein (TIGR03435 family)